MKRHDFRALYCACSVKNLCVFWFIISLQTAGCKTTNRHSDLQLSNGRMQRINALCAGGCAVSLSYHLLMKNFSLNEDTITNRCGNFNFFFVPDPTCNHNSIVYMQVSAVSNL